MRIARLRLQNWMAFRGEQVLDLDAKVYAIVARLAADPERSNWLGKSSLLEAVIFALTGEHRFRTEDEFISDGEARTEVELTFEDGTRALRTRERGKRTTPYFFPKGGAESIKDEAEKNLRAWIGVGPEDLRATCYFEQKKLARFVDTEPAKRMEIVSAWLHLDPLERCEQRAKQLGAGLESDIKLVEGHLQALDLREAEIWKKDPETGKPKWTKDAIDAALPVLAADLEVKKGVVSGLEAALERNAALIAARGKVTDYEQVVAEGKKLRAESEKRNLPILREAFGAASAEVKKRAIAAADSGRASRQAAELAKGNFDGRCPVAGILCPAKDSINGEREKNREAATAARERCAADEALLETAERAERTARAALQEADAIAVRLDALRAQAAKLAPEAKRAKEGGEPEDPIALRGKLDRARGEVTEVELAIASLRRSRAELENIETTRANLLARRRELDEKVGVFRELAVIFGKRGAQRRVAEGALRQIQEGANRALKACGAENEIRVSWAREGKGLAGSCDACGNPFPSSVKVKHCERCGAPRGPKMENKLEIAIARRSGAADDLAGAGFQLAASRWLREANGARWSCALLDEPFGALDAAHRKGFAANLTSMLSGEYGFEQALVVAHNASVLDALPGRIEIVSDGIWSSARVIA